MGLGIARQKKAVSFQTPPQIDDRLFQISGSAGQEQTIAAPHTKEYRLRVSDTDTLILFYQKG